MGNHVWQRFGGVFDVNQQAERLAELSAELENPELWKNPESAKKITQEKAQVETLLGDLEKTAQSLLDAADWLALAESQDDPDNLPEVEGLLAEAERRLNELELARMFSNPLDENDAYLTIQAGSGGTEAQDWAEMLLRMYLRWANQHGFTATLMEASPGEVAGIKSATVRLEGLRAYGWARTESGVHRLVRKSPFDANSRRHTSFAAVFVTPIVDDSVEITINPADLRVDTYRASGAGGQHVNRTDSAIRITHMPTGIVVQSQSDRSQHRNRAEAMSQLKARLYQLEMTKKMAHATALEESKELIEWGYQIRSYVLDDSRVKDLRTGYETTNTQGMLDGDLLDKFIEESLKQGVDNVRT